MRNWCRLYYSCKQLSAFNCLTNVYVATPIIYSPELDGHSLCLSYLGLLNQTAFLYKMCCIKHFRSNCKQKNKSLENTVMDHLSLHPSTWRSPTNRSQLCCPRLVRHCLSGKLWQTVMCVTKAAQRCTVGWRNHSTITAPARLCGRLQAGGDLVRPREERLFSLQWEAWLLCLPNLLQTACQHKSQTAPSLSTCKFTSSAAQEGNVN